MGREDSCAKTRTAAQEQSHVAESSDGGADTGQRELPEGPMGRMTPLRKGSVFDDLMRRRMLPEGSNHASDRERWIRGSKEPKQVNSLTRRNPKKAREQAAQNMQWSNTAGESADCIANRMGWVTGRREGRGDALER